MNYEIAAIEVPQDAQQRITLMRASRPDMMTPESRYKLDAQEQCAQMNGVHCGNVHMNTMRTIIPQVEGVCEQCRKDMRRKGINPPCEAQ